MIPQVKLKSIIGAAVIEYSIGAVWNWLVNTCNKSSSFATQPQYSSKAQVLFSSQKKSKYLALMHMWCE